MKGALNECSSRVLGLTLIATVSTAYSINARGAEYPERLVTAIVPFAAGSSTDVLARRISAPLAKSLGQQIIIDKWKDVASRARISMTD